MAKVSVISCDNYEYSAVRAAVLRILDDAGGADRFFRKGRRVLLKPNLLARRDPKLAVTTHPMLVEAVARIAIEHGASVTIADSPGGTYNPGVLKRVYMTCGMETAAKNAGAQLNFDVSYREVNIAGEHKRLTMPLLSPLLDCDVIINLCKMKTHSMTYLSGCVKNMFGAVAGVYKTQFHYKYPEKPDFCNMLVDLCEYLKPALHIMDAVDAMEGNGPSNGSVRHMGLLLGGENPHAVDAVACRLMGLEESEVYTLVNARRRELLKEGETPEILGDFAPSDTAGFIKPDTYSLDIAKGLPPGISHLAHRILKPPYPQFDRQKCIACKACVKACPADALVMQKKLPRLIKENCITCYCCQEMCPKDAVILKKQFLQWINRFKVGI